MRNSPRKALPGGIIWNTIATWSLGSLSSTCIAEPQEPRLEPVADKMWWCREAPRRFWHPTPSEAVPAGWRSHWGWSVSPSSGSPVGWLSGEMAKDHYLPASEGQIVSPGMSNNRGFEDIGDQLHWSIPYRTLTFIISLLITPLPFSGEMLSPFSKASNQSCRGIANADLPFSSTWKTKERKPVWGCVVLLGKDGGQAFRLCEARLCRQLRLDKTSSRPGTGRVKCIVSLCILPVSFSQAF